MFNYFAVLLLIAVSVFSVNLVASLSFITNNIILQLYFLTLPHRIAIYRTYAYFTIEVIIESENQQVFILGFQERTCFDYFHLVPNPAT